MQKLPKLCNSLLLIGALVASSASTGCKKPGAVANELAKAPSLEGFTGEAKCGVKRSAAKPLIIEWPAAERAALEARTRRGLVAVRYEGCAMEVLTTCTVSGNYEYVGLTRKSEGVKITNADELYAQLPVGAVGLEAKLERAGQLNVDMVIVGRQEADKTVFSERDLKGRCDEATHVITGLTVGAFSFYSGKSAAIAGGVKAGNIGAGAGSSTNQEMLKTDGDDTQCALASTSDTTPPEGCGALLRVEVVPVDRIFNKPTTAVGARSPGSGTPTAKMAPADPEIDKKIRTARLLAAPGYGLILVGGVTAITGYVLYNRAKAGLTAEQGGSSVSADRSKNVSRGKIGPIMGWSGAAVATAGIVLVAWASARTKSLTRQKALRAGVAPMVGPGIAGLSVGGKF